MTNSTSTHVTFGGAWCNRVIANQEDSHSTAPAYKQINENILQPTTHPSSKKNWCQLGRYVAERCELPTSIPHICSREKNPCYITHTENILEDHLS